MSHSDDARHRKPNSGRTPRRAVQAPSWASGDHPEAVDGPFVVERLTALTHDLANLLDGSMRCLGLARRVLGRDLIRVGADELEESRRHVDTVYSALERMADLVHAAMRGSASVLSPTGGTSRPITLQEAVAHAARVVAPDAADLKTRIDVSFADELSALPAGSLYTVVLNGLRNAIESIARVPEPMRRDGGRIQVLVLVRSAPRHKRRFVILEILDDGVGVRSAAAGARAFQIGNSTKPGGLGVGLAMAREAVKDVGGSIELRPRPDIADRVRPGAVLRVTFPWPDPKEAE